MDTEKTGEVIFIPALPDDKSMYISNEGEVVTEYITQDGYLLGFITSKLDMEIPEFLKEG